MNPEDNNPLINPGAMASSSAASNPIASPFGSDTSGYGIMSDGFESTDTSANSNVAADIAAALDEPLVPAAPVPGSIGSAISAPPVASAPVAEPATTSYGATTSANAVSPVMGSGPMPAPAVSPQPAETSPSIAGSTSGFTPFSTVSNLGVAPALLQGSTTLGNTMTTSMNQAPVAAAPINPFASSAQTVTAPQTVSNAASASAAPSMTAAPGVAPAAPASPVAQPEAESEPKKEKKETAKFGSKSMSIILLILVAIFMVSTVIMTVLYFQAANKPAQIIYTNSGQSQAPVKKSLKCSGQDNFGYLVGSEEPIMGDRGLTANYENGELKSLVVNFSIPFADEGLAATAREALAAEQATLMATVANSFTANYNVDGSTVIADISTKDDFTSGDTVMFLYGLTDSDTSTSIETLQEKYESEGLVCTVE